jgi:cytochrome c oxidase subunit 2
VTAMVRTIPDRGRTAVATRTLLPVLAGLSATACLPAPATEQGRVIADLYAVFLAGAVVVALAVWVPATWAIVRHRRARTARDELPPQVRGNLRLELLWTILPGLTVLVLFVLTIVALGPVQARREGSVNLNVTAFRWGWQFDFPDDRVQVIGLLGQPAEVVLPVGEPVHVTLTATDVVHAFYVPAFLYKHDAIPGRAATFDLTIAQPGVYGGQCAEFCGTFHARMPFSIRAVSRPEYEAWLRTQPLAPSQATVAPTAGP